jgi:hypothetical protein
VKFPSTTLKLPPRTVTFEESPKKDDAMIRKSKAERSDQVTGRLWFKFKDKKHCGLVKGRLLGMYSRGTALWFWLNLTSGRYEVPTVVAMSIAQDHDEAMFTRKCSRE